MGKKLLLVSFDAVGSDELTILRELPNFRRIFAELRDRYGCDLLTNVRNMGQGQALKNGMRHYLKTYGGEYKGVIAFDCDGQHLVKDAIRIDKEMGKGDCALILGVRELTRENAPIKSRIGNRIMCNAMKNVTGGSIRDTQTGLRGVPNELINTYLSVPGDHFEYNTAMLLESMRKGITVKEIPIETVYFEKNRATHFRPVRDSVRIIRSMLAFQRATSGNKNRTTERGQ